jgi:hypothetical protein
MKGEGLLKAATESLAATVERIERDREADMRTMSAIMHQLEEAVNRTWELSAHVAEIKSALSKSKAGRLLKTSRMAAQVDLSAKTVRDLARAGRIPGTQLVEVGDWLFDPEQVKAALQRPYTDADGCDRIRDRERTEAHYRQIEKELEQGL